MNSSLKVISLDGGGIRGMATAAMIAEIEKNERIYFSDYFDIFVGVSTGSIIALLLYYGFTGAEIFNIYYENYNKIFTKTGNYSPIYDVNNLNKTINEIIEKINLDKIRKGKELYVSTYNETKEEHEVFNLNDYNSKEDKAAIITASCAAPLYFGSFKFKGFNYLDGGMVTRNPSVLAFSKAMLKTNDINGIKLLSLGAFETLSQTRDDNRRLKDKIMDFIDDVFDSSVYANHLILKDIFSANPQNYLRIDIRDKNEYSMDKLNKALVSKIKNTPKYYKKIQQEVKHFFSED